MSYCRGTFGRITFLILSHFLFEPTCSSTWQSYRGKPYLCESASCSVISDSLWPHVLQTTRFLCPWNSPGKNTGVGCHSFLQGIFQTQGLNLGLLHCRRILYHLSHGNQRVGLSSFREVRIRILKPLQCFLLKSIRLFHTLSSVEKNETIGRF